MRILPVIDLLDGQVVRGIAGERTSYRPIVSTLASDAHPTSIAAAFARLGFRRCYVADLNAIQGDEPDWKTYRELLERGLDVLIDAGCRTAARGDELASFRAADRSLAGIVVALETLRSTADLASLLQVIGRERLVFSLDLKHGRPLTQPGVWSDQSPREIAATVVAHGVRQLIVLDLAAVGTYGGGATLELCRELRAAHPDLKIISGGGVRDQQDLAAFEQAGVDEVLVASALHDGKIHADKH